MKCNDVFAWLRRDLDGSAEPSTEVAEHLGGCEACAREAERLKGIAAAARESLPRAAVPFDFTDRVMDEIVEPTDEAALADAFEPRRSPWMLAAAALLMAIGLLVMWPRGKPGGEETLAEGGGEAAAEAPKSDAVVVLSKHGELVYEGDVLSLDGLTMMLKRKKPGTILLRADKDAPWQHIQWFMTVCAEQGISKTRLAVGRGPVADAFLPTDRGMLNPRNEIKVAIQILGRVEVAEVRGPARAKQNVTVPSRILYKFGDREGTLEAAEKWIHDAKRAAAGAKAHVIGEIKAVHKAPFHCVFSVLRQFHAEGLTTVHFFGTAIPNAAIRRKPYLVYPARNWPDKHPIEEPIEEEEVVEEVVEEQPVAEATAMRRKIADLERQQQQLEAELAAANENQALKARIAELEAQVAAQRKAAVAAAHDVRQADKPFARPGGGTGGRAGRGVAGGLQADKVPTAADWKVFQRLLEQRAVIIAGRLAKEPNNKTLKDELNTARAAARQPWKPACKNYILTVANTEIARVRNLWAKNRRGARGNEYKEYVALCRAVQAVKMGAADPVVVRVKPPVPAQAAAAADAKRQQKRLRDLDAALRKDPNNAKLKAERALVWAALNRVVVDLRDKNNRVDEMKKRIAEVEAQLAALQAQGANRAQIAQVTRQIADLKQKLGRFDWPRDYQGTTDKKPARPKTYADLSAILNTQANEIHSRFQKANTAGDKDAAEDAKVRLDKIDKLFDRARKLRDLDEKRQKLKREGGDTTELDKQFDKEINQIWLAIPRAPGAKPDAKRPRNSGANGVVKAVRGNLVSISVGSNDGVRVGDTYQIRRGAKYVGQVKVTHAYKDQAVGEFDNRFKGPGAPPQAGDIAETRAGGAAGNKPVRGPGGANGVLKSVRGDLVSISVGSNDGVRVGDTYQIRRGAKYVGRVKVTHVYKDQSVGEFDNEFKGPGAPPAAGDAAEFRRFGVR